MIERDAPSLGDLAQRTLVRIQFPGVTDGPVICVFLLVPAQAKGTVPTLLHLRFSPAVQVLDEPGIDEGSLLASRVTVMPGA